MTVSDLYDLIVEATGENEEMWDSEVVIASQPSWPFENSVDEVQVEETLPPEDIKPGLKPTPPKLIIAEGSQKGYLPGHIRNQLGW